VQRSLARDKISDTALYKVLGTKLKPIKVLPALASSLHVLTLICKVFVSLVAEARQVEFSLVMVNRKPLHYLIRICYSKQRSFSSPLVDLQETIFQKGFQQASSFCSLCRD